MAKITFKHLLLISSILIFSSCTTLDKASRHGFNSGFYKMISSDEKPQSVYVDCMDEKIDIYHQARKKIDLTSFHSIPLVNPDTIEVMPIRFRKQSLDIDVVSIIMKYRPAVNGLPTQLTTDLNISLYGGWRKDNYNLTGKKDPLGKRYTEMRKFGYDFGLFAGIGATDINPYTTNNKTSNDYSGMLFQSGMAAFIESNIASFGVAIGTDFLLNSDRRIWSYQKKPWLGFTVGIALN